jgi:hypothetical protein
LGVSAFRVLGPVEAWADQRLLVLGGPRQVALLAFLLLNANRADLGTRNGRASDLTFGKERPTTAGGSRRRAAADDWVLAVVLNGYSSCRPVREDPERARRMVEEALALFRRVGDAAGIAITASTVAEIAVDAEDLEDAERLINESLEGAREVGFRPAIAYGLLDRSIVALLRDDIEGADADLQAAIRTSAPYDDAEAAGETLSAAATIAASRRDPARAPMLWAAADSARGCPEQRRSIARLRARWEPQARAGR